MLDIVEIALDQITDFTAFEKLACEILRDEGYPDIRPLGGQGDKARDAVVERLYLRETRRSVIVFQITTQDTVEAKLAQTIKRLDEEGINYQQLTIVTSRRLSAGRQDILKAAALADDVHLDVMDRKTIGNRLSNFDNGIFARYFPNIESQVKALVDGVPEDALAPEAAVRSALMFTASNNGDRTRDRILNELVLALLLEGKGERTTPVELVKRHAERLPEAEGLQEEQARAVLKRLSTAGLAIAHSDGTFAPSERGNQRTIQSASEWGRKLGLVCADAADVVERSVDVSIDETTHALIERNVGDALGQLFRLMGLEVASQLLGKKEARARQIGSHEAIVEAAKRDLPVEIADVVVAALAEIIARPNDEQAEALNAYACGFVGASLLTVDPAVREFQVTRMREKVFIVDTDFLVDCIVTDRPEYAASRGVLEDLVRCGARVIVPDSSIAEAARHASLAHQTVSYFGDAIFGLSPAQARMQIFNAFAAGWFFRRQRENVSFRSYIANYYTESDPLGLMTAVVRSTLPEEIETGDTSSLLGVNLGRVVFAELSDRLLAMLQASRKSQYRTDDQNRELAATDARLYAAALAYKQGATSRSRSALGSACYIVTSSLKFIRAADSVLDEPDDISTRPNVLAALLRLVAPTSVSSKDFVALFDNPLLQQATMQCRDDVQRLLAAGISTRGKLLARLTFDLDAALHNRLAAVRQSEERADDDIGNEDHEEDVARSYIGLLKEARSRGYQALPTAQEMIDEITVLKADNTRLNSTIEEMTQRFEGLDSAIKVFGRRKQRYLKRLAQGAKPEHRTR